MPIRSKNIDFNSAQMQKYDVVNLGDVTATGVYNIGIAPYACTVKSVDFVSKQATSANSSQSLYFSVYAGTTSTILGVRGTSSSGVNSDNLAANTRYRVVVSSNNQYISAGTVLGVQVSAVCGVLSQVLCAVQYVPRLHKESR
jgi:hypothetical protein